jgi:single-strand DNA-binding protein
MKVSGVGRLVADPEQSGNGPVKFRLASDRYNSSTKEREAQFWSCHAWGKTGEQILKYMKKGRQVFISGDLINREFTGTQGDKVRVTEIEVRDVEFISSGKPENTEQSQGGW